jgi:hypothetical protein
MEQTHPIDAGAAAPDLPSLRDVWDEESVLERLREGRELGGLALRSSLAGVAGCALFGAALGSYAQAPLQVLASAIKVPLLLAGAAALCFPTFFVVQALRSARPLALLRAAALQVNALAVVGLVWGGFSLPVLFLVGTTGHYELAQWLALAIGAGGGVAGFSRFLAGYAACSAAHARGRALRALLPYFVLFGAVGAQLAWTLRPFIGSPSLGFQIFRELEGDIFSHVLRLLG